ncbi:MAG: TIGR00730 family Rossman fold protein [Planctomycetia bacterium]|nr:TIGR00730 family Rossman fold protein [Planctomycetia bacterium]
MDNSEQRPQETAAEIEQKTKTLLKAPSYRKAYKDEDFLQGDDARELRLLAEYMKADTAFRKKRILSTIIVFGSARIKSPKTARDNLEAVEKKLRSDPDSESLKTECAKAKTALEFSKYYEEARKLGEIVSECNQFYAMEDPEPLRHLDYVICTGGGPGIMEAANRGAWDAGGVSIGLNISLPFEQRPNPYITPDLCFQYHYFAMRKMHFMIRARALVAFPGGFGTFDELFEALTLRQTGRMQTLPIILFGEHFWRKCINFEYLAEAGMISPKDLDLITFVETADEAWDSIREFYTKIRMHKSES